MRTRPLWVWVPYSTERGRAFVTELAGLGDTGIGRLLKGEPFARVPRLVASQFETGRFVDNLGAYIGVHLVSPVLADVLKGLAQDHVQLLPVSIKGRPELKYFAVNVLDSVPLLDRDRSKFRTFTGSDAIARVSRLALRPLPPEAPPIFHLAEHPVLVLVNDELRRALEAASRYPGVLTPASKWRDEY
jgi:Immunity protein family (Imm11)